MKIKPFLFVIFINSLAVAKPYTHSGFQLRATAGFGPTQTTETIGDLQIHMNGLSASGYLFAGFGPKQFSMGVYGGTTIAPTVSHYSNALYIV